MSLPEPPLVLTLERLFQWLAINVPRIAQGLQPGLTREQIEVQVQALPFRLPEELYLLYQWRNGGTVEIAPEGHPPYQGAIELLPPYRLLSLEEAIEEYTNFLACYGELEQSGDIPADSYLCFPVMNDSVYYYAARCDTEPKASAAILEANLFAEDRLSLTFNSLTEMMQAIVECCETGVYSSDGYAIDRLALAEEAAIWNKYHPERAAKKANVDSLLSNETQHLSDRNG